MNDISLPVPRPASPEILAKELVDRLTYRVGKDPKVATTPDPAIAGGPAIWND